MTETNDLLRAILGRLEELTAEVKNHTVQLNRIEERVSRIEERMTALEERVTGLEERMVVLEDSLSEFRRETIVSLGRIESRLSHLTLKWMEHDEEIHRLKRGQGQA